MKKNDGISKYKLQKIASESFRNTIRLHFDSILLYKHESYPSAFQLAVLALEEFSKATMVDHYIWSSEVNEGYPDAEFEQGFLKLLYLHSKKQWNFVARDVFEFSPKFVKQIETKELDNKKQQATYVGLSRKKSKIDTESRVSTPWRVKEKDARQIISLINHELVRICARIEEDEWYFEGGKNMDDVLDYKIYKKLLSWPHKTRLKGHDWYKRNLKRN